MVTFNPGQIETAKSLVKWYKSHGYDKDQARLEVANLLTRYEHKKIKSAMKHTACTSPIMLKKILEQRESFKNLL